MATAKEWLPIIIQIFSFLLAILLLGLQQSKDRRDTIKEVCREAKAAGEATGELKEVVKTLKDTSNSLGFSIERLQAEFKSGFTAIGLKIQEVDDKVDRLDTRVTRVETRFDGMKESILSIKAKVG